MCVVRRTLCYIIRNWSHVMDFIFSIRKTCWQGRRVWPFGVNVKKTYGGQRNLGLPHRIDEY